MVHICTYKENRRTGSMDPGNGKGKKVFVPRPLPGTPNKTSVKKKPPFRPAGINTTPSLKRKEAGTMRTPTLRRSTKDVGSAAPVRIEQPQMVDIDFDSRDDVPSIQHDERKPDLFRIKADLYKARIPFSPEDHVIRPGPYAKSMPSLLDATHVREVNTHSELYPRTSLALSKPLTAPPRSSSLVFSTRTSQRSSDLSPIIPRRTNLPLPQEIRDQILSYVLTMASAPVEYLPPAVRKSRAAYLNAYNRSLPPLSSHQQKLRKDYFSLILTSKSIKADAVRALFQFNEWFVRISLVRDLMPEGTGGRQVGLLRGRNGVTELEKTFGQNVLSYIRVLRVKVVSESKRQEREIMTYLASLAYTLSRHPRSLKCLTVEWSNYYSVPAHDSPSTRKAQVKYCRSRRRDENGSYKRVATPWHWCMWENEETILRPLLRVRGVPSVKIMGNVSVQWATYLESVMMGGEGEVERFVRAESMAEFLDPCRGKLLQG